MVLAMLVMVAFALPDIHNLIVTLPRYDCMDAGGRATQEQLPSSYVTFKAFQLYSRSKMPYSHLSDLPEAVQKHLPHHAQEIYQSAFNNAWEEYNHDEERAHRVAWAAVKKKYVKNEATHEWEEK